MMRVRLAVPDAAVGPETLNPMLEAVTRTNEYLLENGHVPHADTAIAKGVKWKPEPPGDEHFDIATTVLQRKHGDCDDLAPYKAASLRVTGEDPEARAIVIPSGKNKWHAIVERGDGSLDDPSADAGMYEYRPPLQPRMMGPTNKPQLATKQIAGVWCARCDLPWAKSHHAISGHAMALTAAEAASRAIQGAAVVGEGAGVAEQEHLIRLAALQDLLRGAHPEAVREAMRISGHPDVGSFFGSLLKTAAHLAPIPGVATAYDAAEKGISMAKGMMSHGGGKKSAASSAPMGPHVGPVEHHAPSSPRKAQQPPPPSSVYNQGPLIIRMNG